MRGAKGAMRGKVDSNEMDLIAKRWPLLLGCHIALAGAVSPVFVGAFALFLEPMSAALHWPRSQLATGMSIFVLASTVCTPFAGRLLDRFGAGTISLVAGIGLPLAIVAFALSPPHWIAFLATAFLVGLFGSLTLPMTCVSILPQWFDRRLGLAMALVVCGLGTGGVVSAMLASWAIAEFGWRNAWFIIAAWSALLNLTGRRLIPWRDVVPRAKQIGIDQPAPVNAIETMSFSKDPIFWLLTLAFTLGLLVTLGVATNLAAAVTDRGLSMAFAASVVAITATAGGVARLIGGAFLDWFGVRIVGGVTFAIQGIGCLLLAFGHGAWSAVAGAALASFAYGVEADMIPYVIRRRYGVRRFGQIYGIMYGFVQLGAFCGPAAVAMTFDRLGSYTLAFATLAGCSAVASLTMLILGSTPPRRRGA